MRELNIKVAIIDDHDLICLGIQQTLTNTPHISFEGGYPALEDFFQSPTYAKVNVVLLDDSLPGVDEFKAIRSIRQHCPDVAIVLLGARLTAYSVRLALRAGASGVICKTEPVQTIVVAAIHYTHKGKCFVSPDAALITGNIDHLPLLSQNLHDVLRLMARDYHQYDIPRLLNITRSAFYKRRKRLREILDVASNEQIVTEAIRRGLLEDDR